MNTTRIRITVLTALALFVGVVGASAQDAPIAAARGPIVNPTSFPGQFWNDTGNVSPTEHNDVISASYLEQGITIFRLGDNAAKQFTITPYVAVGVTADTQGFDWNNRVVGSGGLRLNKYLSGKGISGIVSLGGAYSYEDRWIGNEKKGGLTGEVTYWFGWQGLGDTKNRFPGSTWGAVGYLTPVESHNVIYMQYFKQGVVLHRFNAKNAIVPFGEITTSVDTKHYDWENKYMPGAGVEYVHLHGNTQTELGAEYLYEHRWETGLSGAQATIFLKYWFGWNPIRGGKR
jgi:hypothetical protein